MAGSNDRIRVEAPTAPAMASLNRLAACRILEELVENAIAFSPEDRPVLVRVDLEEGSPVIRVIDEGPGIDAKSLPRIFAPLEQGESLNSRTHQGMGLGPRDRADVGPRDGRRRHPRGDRSGRLDVHVARQRRTGGPVAHLKRRMCTFSNSPAAMKFASIADPP